jgi:hypothetical protein
MKCVCVEDTEYECIEKSEKQAECREIKKRRFNCITQYIDVIHIKQIRKAYAEMIETFTCEDTALKTVELYPKATIIYEYRDMKVLEAWL